MWGKCVAVACCTVDKYMQLETLGVNLKIFFLKCLEFFFFFFNLCRGTKCYGSLTRCLSCVWTKQFSFSQVIKSNPSLDLSTAHISWWWFSWFISHQCAISGIQDSFQVMSCPLGHHQGATQASVHTGRIRPIDHLINTSTTVPAFWWHRPQADGLETQNWLTQKVPQHIQGVQKNPPTYQPQKPTSPSSVRMWLIASHFLPELNFLLTPVPVDQRAPSSWTFLRTLSTKHFMNVDNYRLPFQLPSRPVYTL